MERDYYQVLGVHKGVSSDELRKAYLALAQKHHPDHNPDDEQAVVRFSETRFRQLALLVV